MHKYSKKLFSISMSFLLIISLLSSTMIYGAESDTTTFSDLNVNNNQIVVLYTNDIHGGVSNHSQYSGSSKSLGFAGIAALKEEAAKSCCRRHIGRYGRCTTRKCYLLTIRRIRLPGYYEPCGI